MHLIVLGSQIKAFWPTCEFFVHKIKKYILPARPSIQSRFVHLAGREHECATR